MLSPAAADLPLLTFNQFKHPEEELAGLIHVAFDKFGLLEEFNVPDDVFFAFIEAMRAGYNSEKEGVTYHNFRHAFDVTQMAYFFITQTNAGDIMDNMDIFLLLLCCVGHDVDEAEDETTEVADATDEESDAGLDTANEGEEPAARTEAEATGSHSEDDY